MQNSSHNDAELESFNIFSIYREKRNLPILAMIMISNNKFN
jgi:hypothetical protein